MMKIPKRFYVSQRHYFWGLPWRPSGKGFAFQCRGCRFDQIPPSLVRELRSHMPLWPKNQNMKQKQYCNKFNKVLKKNPEKLRHYFCFIPAFLLRALDYVKTLSWKKPDWRLNVIKILKADFINPINILRPDSMSGFGFPPLEASPRQPTSPRQRWAHLATFWVNFMQLSKKLRPRKSLDSFKDSPLDFRYSCAP